MRVTSEGLCRYRYRSNQPSCRIELQMTLRVNRRRLRSGGVKGVERETEYALTVFRLFKEGPWGQRGSWNGHQGSSFLANFSHQGDILRQLFSATWLNNKTFVFLLPSLTFIFSILSIDFVLIELQLMDDPKQGRPALVWNYIILMIDEIDWLIDREFIDWFIDSTDT